MTDVVSLGSMNVDRIHRVSDTELTELRDRYDWFPDRGQTVQVRDVPSEFGAAPDTVRHGGKGANQAVAAAKAGAETVMLGKVGPDYETVGVLDRLTAAGVGVDTVGISAEQTGTADVFVDPAGDNRIVVRPGANGTVDAAYVRAQYDTIRSAECLLVQNEIPAEPVVTLLSELAAERDRPVVVLDPAPVDGVDALLECDAVDYLTPNETEYRALQPSLGEFDGVLVRKRGADDVVVEAERRFTVTPPPVDAVDTTGAGDVLNGVLAARLAAGASRQDAVESGTVAGALSTRGEGARRGIPTLEEVRTHRRSDDLAG